MGALLAVRIDRSDHEVVGRGRHIADGIAGRAAIVDIEGAGVVARRRTVVDTETSDLTQRNGTAIAAGRRCNPAQRYITVRRLSAVDRDAERYELSGCSAIADADNDISVGTDIRFAGSPADAARRVVESCPRRQIGDIESQRITIDIHGSRRETVGRSGANTRDG